MVLQMVSKYPFISEKVKYTLTLISGVDAIEFLFARYKFDFNEIEYGIFYSTKTLLVSMGKFLQKILIKYCKYFIYYQETF